MTPLAFLRRYAYDDRLVTGAYYPDEPLEVDPGDRIGVVLLQMGGPRSGDEVESFLYNLFMDPAIIDIPLKGRLREWLCRFIARKRSETVREEYGLIGGGSPIGTLTEKQAEALEAQLNRSAGVALEATFHTYVAMRYAEPSTEEAARKMAVDNVNKVVLLPLYPQYSKTTSGSSLLYWWALEEAGEIERRPTVSVFEYATHPSYVDAINVHIDEALEQFPEGVRADVHVLFSAHGTPLKELTKRGDPYRGFIEATVERVMASRTDDRPFQLAFQSKVGPGEWLSPSTPDTLKELGEAGNEAVLVVPIAFVSDHVETAFELDIEVRAEAEAHGIKHYIVSGGLNDHPLFIEALSDVTRKRLTGPSK